MDFKETIARCGYAFGFGLIWYNWIVTIFFQGNPDALFAQGPSRVLTLVGVFFAVGAFVIRFRGSAKAPRPIVYVSAVLFIGVGTAFTYFGNRFFSISEVAFGLASILFGMGTGAALFSFFALLAKGGLRQMRFGLLASIAGGFFLYLVTSPLVYVNPVVFGALEMSYPLLSIPVYLMFRRHQGNACQKPQDLIEESALKTSLLRISIVMIVYGVLVGGSFKSFSFEDYATANALVAASVVALTAVFSLFLRRRSKVSDILQCGKLCVIVGALGLMLRCASRELATFSLCVVLVSYALFFTTVLVFYAAISRYQKVYSGATVLSAAIMADSLGLSLGFAMRELVSFADASVVSCAYLLAAAFFVVAGAFLFNKHALFPVGSMPKSLAGQEVEYVRLTQLSEEYALTPRQREVFFMLATGERAESIAARLTLSVGTVRGHVNQIYGKLGVHSNKELLALARDEHVETADRL